MANIKSAIKRNRQNDKRRLRNKTHRSRMRTEIKNAEATVGTDEGAQALRDAIKYIDKAAAKGVIHKNAAARKKSRLVKRLASIES